MKATQSQEASDAVLAMQARFNRSTHSHWDYFASHRAAIEQLLLPDCSHPAIRLCVLGAGNCNDLHLPHLLERFGEIHLVDLDRSAVEEALQRQGVDAAQGIRIHAPVDLTGIAKTIGEWRDRRPTPAEINTAIKEATSTPMTELAGLAGRCDVVLSPCILSQIVGYARDALGPGHPCCPSLRLAVRQRHLRLMVDLLSPGGSGLLVSDLATATPPAELSRSGRLLREINRGAKHRGTYQVLDPDSVKAGLINDAQIAPLTADLRFIAPWLWTLGPRKTFMVYALRLRRASGTILL